MTTLPEYIEEAIERAEHDYRVSGTLNPNDFETLITAARDCKEEEHLSVISDLMEGNDALKTKLAEEMGGWRTIEALIKWRSSGSFRSQDEPRITNEILALSRAIREAMPLPPAPKGVG